MARLDGFQKLALSTTLATYGLMVVGAIVRAVGAGLGCPDWPKCFGGWIPPTDASQLPAGFDASQFSAVLTWTEYVNRLLGVIVGFLIFATLAAAVRTHRQRPRILWPTVAAFVLVGFEGWLGGRVVAEELASWIVSVHLLVAFIIVSLLLYATVHAFVPDRTLPKLSGERRVIAIVSSVVFGLVLAQAALGTFVRAAVERVVRELPDLARSDWLAEVGTLDMLHRQVAVLCFIATGWLAWRARRSPRALRLAATGAFVLCGLQIAAGLDLAYLGFPPAGQVAHVGLASLLLGALTLVTLLSLRLVDEDHRAPD